MGVKDFDLSDYRSDHNVCGSNSFQTTLDSFDGNGVVAFGRNPFDSLPIETVQHIASQSTYDSDLCNFRLICRSTHDAVDADNCSFWRRRFLDLFESSEKLKEGGESASKRPWR